MTPREVCLDANIFVASLVPSEPDHSAAFALLQMLQDGEYPVFEPSVVLSEFVSVIHRKIFLGEILPERRDPLIDLFFELPLMIQWQASLMKRGAKMAADLSLRRLNDYLYLATAMNRDIPLVTLDEDLRKKGRKFFDKIYSPEEFLAGFTPSS